MRHHFTIDVEEYFQVAALEPYVPRSDWARLESRVAGQMEQLLALLARHHARATCFVVGWLADRQRELIRTIAKAGHEIASHGWEHAKVTTLSPVQFRESVRRSKQVLEEIATTRVDGYRAPNFSIVQGREWALDILIEEGYRYDSSLFPVRRPGYGYPTGRADPYWIERAAGRIAEIPPTTLRCAGMRFPAAGGAYFRLFPYGLVRAALRQCERRGTPGTFYIHPWEIDPAQPRLAVSWLTSARHYGGLRRTLPRLERLLTEFRFRPIGETVPALARAHPSRREPAVLKERSA
ncbi:MAG: polysaccharide deacetylase family protein [Gemmatimonadetes bacterium]|nr:MAG: polysaccharide deacetylase family protein [Gemmatimonadota bacterium]